MAIWKEIKKAINSNIEVPLNEQLMRDYEYMNCDNNIITIADNGGGYTTGTGTKDLIYTYTVEQDTSVVSVQLTSATSYNGAYSGVAVDDGNGTTLASSRLGASNTTQMYTNVVHLYDIPAGTVLKIYITKSDSNTNVSWRLQRCVMYLQNYSDALPTDEGRSNGVIGDVVYSYVNTNNYHALELTKMPKLDRCEFNYWISNINYYPLTYTFNGVNYVRGIPPHCVMRVKY